MIISLFADETREFGRRLAATLRPGNVIALTGDLGAGKTCFVKGIAQGLDITEDITSPTFTLIHEYRGGRLPLYHADLYRLESLEEAVNIGIEEYLAGRGVTVVEWAEKIQPLLPPGTLHLRLTVTGPTSRTIETIVP